jgi:hypothetical protein
MLMAPGHLFVRFSPHSSAFRFIIGHSSIDVFCPNIQRSRKSDVFFFSLIASPLLNRPFCQSPVSPLDFADSLHASQPHGNLWWQGKS